MLMEILGTVIGFVAIILLLSLIVTALVQFLENVFGLRARNLRHGLELLVEDHFGDETFKEGDDKESPKERRASVRKIVDDIVETPASKKMHSANIIGRVINPPVSWIESDQLIDSLAAGQIKISKEKKTAIASDFKKSEGLSSQRFRSQIRLITLLCSIPVAFVFQASTPKILSDLSLDPQLRARAVAMAEGLSSEAEATLAAIPTYLEISDRALEELEEMHADLAPAIEQVGGIGSDREDVLSELRDVLSEEAPQRCESVVSDYAALLDKHRSDAAMEAVKLAANSTSALARLNIVPWHSGWGFYSDFQNIIGVLVTIILMSFGAPFWFAKLEKLLKLRDSIQPRSKPQA